MTDDPASPVAPEDPAESGGDASDESGPVTGPEAFRDIMTDPNLLKTLEKISGDVTNAIRDSNKESDSLAKDRLSRGDRYYRLAMWQKFTLSVLALGSVVTLFAMQRLSTDSAVPLLAGIIGSLFLTPRKPSDS